MPGSVPGAGRHPALGELAVVTALGQFCNSGGTCAHFSGLGFSITDSFLASHAIFACLSLFSWIFNTLPPALSELSEIVLVWRKVANLPLIPVPVCHIWAPWGDVTLFFPLS